MSTQAELLEVGVLRMRKKRWIDHRDHLEYKRVGKYYSPWVILWSPCWLDIAASAQSEGIDDLKLYRQEVLIYDVADQEDDWEAYDGPACAEPAQRKHDGRP